MKTTLNIHDALLYQAKALAVEQRTTLTRLIEEGLRMRLASRPAKSETPRPPIKLRLPSSIGGMMPGIDPCSNQSMYDAADREMRS
jgi:hypothetical protein